MKYILSVSLIYSLLLTNGTVVADTTNSSNLENSILATPQSKEVQIISSDENHITYAIEDAATIKTETGETLEAPAIVNTKITSESGEEIHGESVYEVDLNKATPSDKSVDNFELIGAVGTLLGSKKVFAYTQNIDTNQSQYDNTYSVKMYTTVHWVSYDGGVQKNITSVSGGYSILESGVSVTSSSVEARQGGIYGSQRKVYNPGSRSSWSFSTGFRRVNPGESRVVTNYTVQLQRYGSHWSATLQNNPW